MQALSSSQYKYTTFFVEIQISLTSRNIQATVKMRQFAAACIWRVLYYEEHMANWYSSTSMRGAGGCNSRRFRDRAFLESWVSIWLVSNIYPAPYMVVFHQVTSFDSLLYITFFERMKQREPWDGNKKSLIHTGYCLFDVHVRFLMNRAFSQPTILQWWSPKSPIHYNGKQAKKHAKREALTTFSIYSLALQQPFFTFAWW